MVSTHNKVCGNSRKNLKKPPKTIDLIFQIDKKFSPTTDRFFILWRKSYILLNKEGIYRTVRLFRSLCSKCLKEFVFPTYLFYQLKEFWSLIGTFRPISKVYDDF